MRAPLMLVMAVVAASSMTARADDQPKPRLITKVFSVADLVTPIPDRVQVGGKQVPEPPKPLLADKLIEKVTKTIRPQSWDTAGGSGCIQFYDVGCTLSVTNTPDVVAEVNDLLESLRKLQDTNVVFNIRVLAVPAEVALPACPAKEGDVTFLTERQLKAALGAVQANPRANVMQAPKVTAFPGQEVTMCITETQSFVTGLEARRVKGQAVLVPKSTPVELGTTFALRGQISEDKKFVAVNASYTNRRVEGNVELIPVVIQVTPLFEGGSQGTPMPLTQYLQSPQIETTKIEKKDLKVPSGGHAVIAGPTYTRETRTEFGPPLLSEVPYLGRLFKNVAYFKTTMRTILIVSPVVIENQR